MLHLWWARRPLASCRGAIYAAFADPAVGEDRERLPAFFEQLCHWTGPILPESPALTAAREVVSVAGPEGSRPRILDLFAGGGAIPLEALRLGADAVALDLNPVAHLIQRCCLEFPQRYGKRLRDAVEGGAPMWSSRRRQK
jgi:putative DNA methylase